MDKRDVKILLFRYHPYVIARTRVYPKQEVHASKKRSLFPPVGLAQIAAVLKKAGYEKVKTVDAWAEGLDETAFLEIVEEFSPNIVGCTLWTTSLNSELAILEKIKQKFPDVTTIAGGPHFDVYPRECLIRSDFIEYGVVGEAEESAVELVDALQAGDHSLSEIKGIVYRENGEVVFTGPRQPVMDLDTLPFPDFTDLPVSNYYAELEQFAPFIYIFSTRGCPYRCRYCHNSRGKRFRKHSVNYLIAYIKHLQERYGLKEISFFDDTFTFDKERTLLFCKRYKEEDIGAFYNIRTRANHVDEEIILALKESGCRRIIYGVESGNQEIMDKMNRKLTLDQVREAVALTKKHGIAVGTNFMIGYMDESRETYKNTIRFIRELNPDHINLFITTPLPGTDLYSEAVEGGIIKGDIWRDLALGRVSDIDPEKLRIPGKDYGVNDLDRMLARAYRRIYFRPRFILKKLRVLRSPGHLKRYLMQAMTMLFPGFLRSSKETGAS